MRPLPILRDAAKTPLLRMRTALIATPHRDTFATGPLARPPLRGEVRAVYTDTA
jgi:hypothetical protein